MSTNIEMLTAEEVCELLDGAVSKKTLANWRSRPDKPGPPFYRYGGRIRYRRTDLDAWIEDRRHTSTQAYRGQGARTQARKLEAERDALEERRQTLLRELAVVDSQLTPSPKPPASPEPTLAVAKRGPGRPRKTPPPAIEPDPPRPPGRRPGARAIAKRPRGRPRKPR